MPTRVEGFAPLWRPDARILVLGSMPGVASLTAGRYYAHPRNAFWVIVDAALGVPHGLGYRARTRALCAAGVAVWDVVRGCRREGSLDAAIRDVEANDVQALVRRSPDLRAIFCNGQAARSLLTRSGQDAAIGLPIVRLPSTSPAHAAMPVDEKIRVWSTALREHGLAGAHPEHRRIGPG